MKKIICLIALLLALPSIAQERKNTIVVVGETEKVVVDDTYTIIIGLQQVLVYEGPTEIEATSLNEVTENFIKKLKNIGIDFNRFKRNNYYEFAMSFSQNRESAYYYLKSSDKEEVRKLIQLKSSGMSIVNTEMEATELTDKQLVELSIKAIADAKERATAIAKKMNKTVGEIVSISDQNTKMQIIQGYGISSTQPHSVTVAFELK